MAIINQKRKNPFELNVPTTNNGFTQNNTTAPWVSATQKPYISPTGQSKIGDNIPSYVKSTPITTPVTDPTADYLKSVTNIGEKQKLRTAQRQAEDTEFYNKLYDKTNENLTGGIPLAEKGFEQFKTGQAQRVKTAQESLPQQEEQINTQFGGEQKERAMTRRESEGRLRNMFAGMNATDSYGAGSYTQEASKLENTFNTQTGSAIQQRLGQIFKVRQDVKDVENEANSLVAQEELKLQATIRSINQQVGLNDLEKQKLVREAYRTSQDKVDEIDDYLNGLKYENSSSGLSAEFLKTGIPTNAKEIEFLQKNKDAFSTMNKGTGGNQGKALTLVNNLLSGNLGAISGAVRTGDVPLIGQITGGATAKTDYEGLKSLLALAERGQLKGSGAVSDFEAQMLEKAAMAGLNPRLPTDEFKRRLTLLQQDLMSGGATSNQTQTIRVKNLQTGQTGTLPASEFDPSLYQQI